MSWGTNSSRRFRPKAWLPHGAQVFRRSDPAQHPDVTRADGSVIRAGEAIVHSGIDRNAMMARHKANHIQVVYANSADDADRAMNLKAALAAELGVSVKLCGV